MRNLLNPKWLFIINTLPIAILFPLLFAQFNIIKTLLEEESIQIWKYLAILLSTLAILNFLYAIYLNFSKKNVSIWYGFIALFSYILFIYLYSYHLNTIIPINIPRWLILGNVFLYVGTFLMPTLIYSLFILIYHFISEEKKHKPWIDFLIAIGIPIVGYLFTLIILPLWQYVEGEFYTHVLIVLTITTTLIFLFFLVRGLFILATNKSKIWQKYQLVWKIPISILLPLIGLLLNNGELSYSFGSGIFGNFNNIWFYIIAIINGIFICLPSIKNNRYRIFLYIGRNITLSYTLYFFLVFLPFLPVSVLAIIAIGTGFLMLTPLLLFAIHINELSKDFSFLQKSYSKNIIFAISILSFLTIPIFITSIYLKDKIILNQTLSYLYTPDYSRKYNIDKVSLQKTLDAIKHHKDRRGSVFGNQTPYLSLYFKWLVMGNLTLSDSKIHTIESVFFGNYSIELEPETIQSSQVKISNISTNSVYDHTQNAWKSWVNLEITNNTSWIAEYATTLDLPEGCWISDYYLYVGDKKEAGILAEKKTAKWIFSQIRNKRKDPGILYYLRGNKVAFRIFPFLKNEVRKTGIEFLHKEPLKLKFEDHIVELGTEEETVYESIETENVVYISSKEKEFQKKINRQPYFHFLIDISKNKNLYLVDFINRIDEVLKLNKNISKNSKISFVNSNINTMSLDQNWKEKYKKQSFQGGFYLEKAINTVLFNSYQEKLKKYPIIVVVTSDIRTAILNKNFSDFKFSFPESNLFFNLGKDGILKKHSLIKNPKRKILKIDSGYNFYKTVLEYKISDNSVVYLPDNTEASIVLKKDYFKISETNIKEKNWSSALMMHGKWQSQILHPEVSDKEWLNLIKYSFTSKVMTPVTSYLVVENQAQKEMLKRKQKQVLSNKKSLDLGEDIQRMTEPSLILLIILLGLFLWFRQKRKEQLW